MIFQGSGRAIHCNLFGLFALAFPQLEDQKGFSLLS
jgi:hypothetical protein